jgi:hypothetical protein
MGGGLMQLVAYGAQDIYLTGQPQITFFKSVYRRYTNFAVESIQQEVNGSPAFGAKVSVTISRNGDLLKRLWIEYSPYDILGGIDASGGTPVIVGANLGHSLIDYVEMEIGGIAIDRQYGTWLTIWSYLTESNPCGEQGAIDNYATAPGETVQTSYYGTTGEPSANPNYVTGDNAVVQILPRPTKYSRMSYNHRAQVNVVSNRGAAQYAWIPLQFWFDKNPGLAIPLIALQYHEVKLNILLNSLELVRTGTNLTGQEFSRFAVYADMVYLDATERRQFAENAHEYLIEQLQVNNAASSKNITLSFNHPVKELVWCPVSAPVGAFDDSGNKLLFPTRYSVVPGGSTPSRSFTQSTQTNLNTYKLSLNGTDRMSARDITYFTRNQVWECHTGFGSVIFPDCIAVYSFALRPEEYQPSGTCNFSRIDRAQLIRDVPDLIDIYAINFNVFRIASGMGGLAYSN